jgi:5-methylcytosine-specific restriction endonuclease McrA
MQDDSEEFAGISKEVAERLVMLQPRCVNCPSTFMLHIHHAKFRSEEYGFAKWLSEKLKIYEKCYGRKLQPWGIHDIQNLCRLCVDCHEGSKGVHGGNQVLRKKLANEFTDPITGFRVPFYKKKVLW